MSDISTYGFFNFKSMRDKKEHRFDAIDNILCPESLELSLFKFRKTPIWLSWNRGVVIRIKKRLIELRSFNKIRGTPGLSLKAHFRNAVRTFWVL